MSLRRRMILAVWFGLMFAPNIVWAQCTNRWDIQELAQHKEKTQTLRADGQTIAKVSTDWVRSMAKIKQRIDRASNIQTRLYLCGDSEPNAFATITNEGNVVGLSLGMAQMLERDWDAYAAILGHENAHITLGHHRETQQREAVIEIVQFFGTMALESLIGGNSGRSGLGNNLTSLGASLVSNVYSRENETEADREGIRYTILAGYDPQGAIRLHQALNSSGGFLSSHPGSKTRIADLQKTITELSSR